MTAHHGVCTIISLNDLPNTPHNALFKIFASKRKQKKAAFVKLEEDGCLGHILELPWLIYGLFQMFSLEVDMPIPELTSKDLKEMGKIFGPSILRRMTPEERKQWEISYRFTPFSTKQL